MPSFSVDHFAQPVRVHFEYFALEDSLLHKNRVTLIREYLNKYENRGAV